MAALIKPINPSLGKLILVEGLTGSGKSILAHFLSRQLQYNGIAASWVHEGEKPHPIMLDVETSIEDYMVEMLKRWAVFADQIRLSGEDKVVGACFFNNLIESLLIHNVERSKIVLYVDKLQTIIDPLNPMLVYLVQEGYWTQYDRREEIRKKDLRRELERDLKGKRF